MSEEMRLIRSLLNRTTAAQREVDAAQVDIAAAQVDITNKSHYVAVTPTNLVDSAAGTWGGTAKNIGTYTFQPADNSTIWPADAEAVIVLVYAVWAGANNTYLLSLRRASGGANEVQLRAQVADIGAVTQGIVALDASGYFYAVVEGANTTGATIRIVGYIK